MSAEGVTIASTSNGSSPPASSPSNTSQPPAPSPTSDHDGKDTTPEVKMKSQEDPVKGQCLQDAPEELDDFGLPIRPRLRPQRYHHDSDNDSIHPHTHNSSSPTPEPKTEPTTDPTEVAQKHSIEGVNRADGANGANGASIESQEPSVVVLERPESPQGHDSNSHPQMSSSNRRKAEISEWSHMRVARPNQSPNEVEEEEEEEDDWKEMPALGEFDYYDDYGRLVARGDKDVEDNEDVYRGLGGAGKGYTRVQLDEDAQSATSMDEDTSYLFREAGDNSAGLVGEELRDSVSQLQATKDLLNDTQKIAYVGVVRLAIHVMTLELTELPKTRSTRKIVQKALDAMRKWGQTIMGRLYMHMDIDVAEQVMIEQLAGHGVQPEDLIRPLMQNARVKNPMAETNSKKSYSSLSSPTFQDDLGKSSETGGSEIDSPPPPPYVAHESEEPTEVQMPSQMPTSARIDIDLRWTVLCDLFLVLIADSVYDARSRTLLERVAAAMDISWLQISRFEKRVIDSLEMHEQAEQKENWDESEHMAKRKQMDRTRKFMIMGLATVGGGLVIGLSAGLLAPVIGAGLAAGLTTVGISGTSAFLGGAGGTALIASGATLSGSAIGLRAADRRTGAVQTFEYRPLHNNKKLNLIVTVSGWMTGKVDDVRLPYSTVDPIMGDIYSVLWEPEMLRSMGDTINILATEALTQGLQQVLGSTVLMALMASLQLPLVLTKLAYLIDNPWTVSMARAHSAGLVMADSLRQRNLGNRPITLLGFSLGARVIFSCLTELANKGAHGLIQNVYLFGSPIVTNKDEYLKARSVVSGRFVNGYSKNDWILGYLFRATSGGIMRVSGLAPIETIPGVENFDLTQLVNGHMDYRSAMPRILREVGWEVLDDEFAEIEDPDPDNHAERQRELIREIDEARREAELKPEKKRFGLFKRGKMAEKKSWETYNVDRNAAARDLNDPTNVPGSILFDIEAIRAELASEAIEVKQLESTLPPMRLNLNPPSESSPVTPNEKTSKVPEPPVLSRTQSAPPLNTSPSIPKPYEPSQLSPKEEIEMTFDTSYREPSQIPRSVSTMPNIGVTAVGAMALEPNAWADDYEGEGEFQMTFE